MWLFTRHGFFSIVQDETATKAGPTPDYLLVRARCFADIRQFVALLDGLDCHVCWHETPDKDYRFRLSAPAEKVAEVVQKLTCGVNYPNFKRVVHGELYRDRAYAECWGAMAELQEIELERRNACRADAG